MDYLVGFGLVHVVYYLRLFLLKFRKQHRQFVRQFICQDSFSEFDYRRPRPYPVDYCRELYH